MSLDKTTKQADAASNTFVCVSGEVINYGEMVNALVKKMPSFNEDLLHAAVGISGEAGELLDAVKKSWVYNKPLDIVNIEEELGDLLFYITAAILVTGMNLSTVLQANAYKLEKRYAGLKYSDEAAQARADKVEELPLPVAIVYATTPVDPAPITAMYEDETIGEHRARAITGWPQGNSPVLFCAETEAQDYAYNSAPTPAQLLAEEEAAILLRVATPAPVIQLVTTAAEGRLLGNPEAPARP